VAHNPISNLKLGSGYRCVACAGRRRSQSGARLGWPVQQRFPPACSTSSKSAALLHKVTNPEYRSWPTAAEVLWAATRGGARSARLAGEVGAIAPGYKADSCCWILRSLNFKPPLNERGLASGLTWRTATSITEVWVNGQPVVRDGRCLLIDEQAVLDELRGLGAEYLERYAKIEELNQAFEAVLRRDLTSVAAPNA